MRGGIEEVERSLSPKTKAPPTSILRSVERVRVLGNAGGGVPVTKWVYDFSEGDASQKYLLGGKGANLAEMTNLGLPVPPGFTITCEACNAYRGAGGEFPEGLLDEAAEHRKGLEETMSRQIGDPNDPLLVSVRSGAPFSMPGMMDTVLNVGLNDESIKGLIRQTKSERFA